MRAGVWSAAALLLLAAVTAALRTAQVEGVRNSRRLSNFDSRGSTSTEKIDDAQPTFRSRSYRRRDETSTPVARDITRSKSRNRAPEPLTSNAVTEQSPTDNGRNERFDSRRTNRIRSRPIESQNAVTTFPSRDSTVNNKARQSNRRSQYTTTTVSSLAPSSSVTSNFRRDVNRRAQTTTTEAVTILSSPTLDEFKSEITASSFDDFTRTVPKEEDITTVQFKKRSTTAKSVEVETQASTKAPRTRGRVSPKTNIKLDDMASSGATNILSISENNLIVEKSSEDAKKSRKLRYRTRLSETDTNLTGEGITTSNEIIKTSRKQLKQPESRTTTLAPTERKVQRNVERNSSKSSIVKSMRVVRRPVSRGNENGTTLPKVKTSDEIGDDDNYPASFKAIIQAKNASTQVSSPPSESLSVKATHTAINTNTKTSLPSNTSIESNNFTRLRSKLNTTENDVKNGDEKLSDSPLDSPKLKSEEYKLRGTYSSRPRKVKTENLKTTTTTSSPNAVKTSYKYTRKLRTTTSSPVDFKSSESPRKFKRFESGQSPQTASRPLYSRTKIGKNIDKPAETVTDDSSRNNLNTSVLNNSVKLPRTSYYSRLRNNVKNGITTTAESANTDINNPFKAAKKTENTAETPLIYTMLNKQTKAMSEETNSDTKGEFLLAVSSKESQENNVETDPVTNAEESENMPVINVFSTTQKYHANYKDQGLGNDRQKNEYVATSATPVIRNIQTRKYTRKIFKSKENVESSSVNPVSKSKERALRKYSDTFSKTTEASTNGITTDPEKPKSRFSSKYRASNLDKPFYKPTVPTVTTTTAWLKFFVTDRQLTKSIKEPKWFDGNDFNDDTTELISRQNATTMAFTHQSSELEVGEEILLGPDMNAISFTQTRSALSSADLRLSESLEKPSQVMNVEASNHSPSVTVSIFDALAEILTSTPRIQISTTTDVPQQTFTDSVVKQTLNSVSSNNNVNSVSDFSSQGTSTSTESLTTITTVQNTDQTTPTVLNRLSVEESVSTSLNMKENTMSTNNPQTTLTPTPTTPISARRPFAIKVLYSDTERPTDVPMTSSKSTTKWSTTENTKMIPTSALNLNDSSSFGITTATIKPSAEKSTASHVLNLRTTTMLPSIHEILLNSLSSATKEEMVISSMKSSTPEPRILTLDIDPETKQIRTEKPNDGQGNTVFKFIPIDEITVPPQETNVLTLASTKAPSKSNNEKEVQIVTPISVMEINSPTPEIQTSLKNIDEPTTTVQPTVGTPNVITLADNNIQSTMITSTTNPITTVQPKIESTTSNLRTTTFNSIENSNTITTTVKNVITTFEPTTERYIPDLLTTLTTTSMPLVTTTDIPSTTESVPVPNNSIFTTTEMTKTATDDIQGNNNINQENANLLQMLQSILSTNTKSSSSQEIDQMKLLQALLLSAKDNVKDKQKSLQTTTVRTIQDEIRQFEEDTKFLKALLQATGRDPAELNIPNLNDIKPTLAVTTTMKPITTTTQAPAPTTTSVIKSTTSIAEDLKKIKEDTQLLQALLQATGQTVDTLNLPVISGITSNVRIASNPRTTSIESNPTTPMNVRPIYTTIQSTEKTTTQTNVPQTISTLPTLQEQQSTVKEDIGISTTYRPVQRRITTTTTPPEIYSTLSARRAPSLAQVTTEVPSTSTFSVEEDLAFLNNLKTVLNTNNNDDPEAALANRVIALAVERSLNELQTGTPKSSSPPNVVNSIRTTRPTTTTTTMTTTTVYIPPVSTQSTPSIEDDIKQFEEDTKLLQALLKATGQDPSKFNIPTLPSVNKPNKDNQPSVLASPKTTTKPFGVKIAVKDELKNVQDDAQLLQTLIKLKDAQETTTQRNKIAITGQSSDEALQKLIQKAKPTAMVSEATKSSVSLSTEYGNSNDALLAALLKEQGFGPTTASSLDEQVRLAALLNQVVVTPKARRTTTPPPPPPAPRRPILDGLAWLWQQWRDTAPGAGGAGAGAAGAGGSRTNSRRPAPAQAQAPASSPTAAATPAPSRVNWFGSGPFVGNADDRPASNRIPLEPPRAVAAEQSPGRGQLVSAAINVTRAFSQFLGAAIQGAAQTVQNVIRAGQKAATDVYTNGSG
ncbi:flocculation protein FLO11-like isoform X11 [Papilio machaon]|uniref:flocculation protein FLO11-like isoform X11 n=1 Tax=Papilio machaon TaxID=76193 RepID=UPI001E66445C|nr:flocculation protein FLO11-like isoform X11 [Papilio machaon]